MDTGIMALGGFDGDGLATVVKAAPTYKLLAGNRFGEGFWASPVVSGNAVLLLTKRRLYRVGESRAVKPDVSLVGDRSLSM